LPDEGYAILLKYCIRAWFGCRYDELKFELIYPKKVKKCMPLNPPLQAV